MNIFNGNKLRRLSEVKSAPKPEVSERAKVLSGIVVSNKMKDTVVVLVERYKKHPKYGKFTKRRKKFKAHDVGNTKSIGERVKIAESKPISKDKHFVVI